MPAPAPVAAAGDLDCVDLLLFIVDGVDDGLAEAACSALLTAEERTRYAAIPCPLRRRARLVARGLFRHLAGRLLGRDGASVELTGAPWTKPRLAGSGVEFSISHSAGRVALAFCRAAPVGVDIEHLRPRPSGRFAENCCSPLERRELTRLSPPRRLPFLYARWTLKEALLKATGEGLSQPMRSIEMNPLGDDPDLYACRRDGRVWSCRSWIGGGYAWATAVPAGSRPQGVRLVHAAAAGLLPQGMA